MSNSIPNNLPLLRDLLKKQRSELSSQETSRGSLLIRGRIFTWLATNQTRLKEEGRPTIKNIAAFWSMQHEPQLQALLEQWVEEHNYTVSLPVVTANSEPLQFRVWDPKSIMEEGPYGIQQPTGKIAPAPQIMLVPTLGYTRKGDRIGYGGGFYDRTIAQLKAQGHNFVTLGVAWSTGDLNNEAYEACMPYTPQQHDQPLDGVITDKGWPMTAPII